MIKRILRATSSIFSFFLAITSFFSGVASIQASQLSSGENIDISNRTIIEETSDSIDDSKTNAVPDLGDDQAFPFIPGFGKNSGKD